MMWYNSQFVLLLIMFLVVLAIYTLVKIFDILVSIKDAIANAPFIPQQIFYGILWSSIFALVCFEKAPALTITSVVTIWSAVILRIVCAIKYLKIKEQRDREELLKD